MSAKGARPWLLALPLVIAALLATGCGDDEQSDEAGAEPAAEAPERPGEAADADDGEASDERGGAVHRALEACRQVVQRAPGVSDEKKRELIADCEAAAAGDEEAVRKASHAACDVIAAATAPAILRGQVAAACKRAIGSGSLL